jgi:tRNA threonylcarbamoyladenosine biosynthesis protein TsaB
MKVLGIDTATSTASIALIENGRILAEEQYPPRSEGIPPEDRPKSNYTEILLPLIAAVLRRAGAATLVDLGGIAASIGPGSFTGVRIGLGTVKGLVYGTAVPTVGISTLHANAARIKEFDGIIGSLLDARKNEVYAAFFRKAGNSLKRMTEDMLIPANRILETVASLDQTGPCLFIGDGATAHRGLLQNSPSLSAGIASEDGLLSLAASAALIGEGLFANNAACSVADLAPVYLRRPECESGGKHSHN